MLTVRLTRQELITIVSLLRGATDLGGELLLAAVAAGFNEAVRDSGIRRLRPMTPAQIAKLVARLERIAAQ
jgi:hypothetical protein